MIKVTNGYQILGPRGAKDPDFVTGQCTAGPGPVDKEFVCGGPRELSNQADKEFVADILFYRPEDMDKVMGVPA